MTTVSIVGAGNTGCALTADLKSRGFQTMLYTSEDHPGSTAAILSDGQHVQVTGKVVGRFRTSITHNIQEALKFSAFLLLTIPSYAQEDILRQLEQHDLSQHILVVMPGNLFAFTALRRINPLCILETSASPFASRLIPRASDDMRSNSVHISGCKSTLPIAAWPTNITQSLKHDLAAIFPTQLKWCKNIIEVSLYNFNGIFHPAPALMNAGWVEHTKGDFYFYGQGITPAVAKVMDAIDKERVAIGTQYAAELPSCLEQMNRYYGESESTFSNFTAKSVHASLKLSPTTMNHRYLTEDIPYILVPWFEFAVAAGLREETSVMESIIRCASIVNGTNHLKTGRTLERLGLGQLSAKQILRLANCTRAKLKEMEPREVHYDGGFVPAFHPKSDDQNPRPFLPPRPFL